MRLSLAAVLLATSWSGGQAFATTSGRRRGPARLSITWTTTTTTTTPSSSSSSSQLYASTLVDASLLKPPGGGWHRRVFRRVWRWGRAGAIRRHEYTASSSSSYGYSDIALQQQQQQEQQQRRKWFLLAAFQQGRQRRPLELSMAATTTTASIAAATTTTAAVVPRDNRLFYDKWLERSVERNLLDRFDQWTEGMHDHMAISCSLLRHHKTNKPTWQQLLLAGTITANVQLTAQRLVFGAFSCSGGTLTAKAISVNLKSFTKQRQRRQKQQQQQQDDNNNNSLQQQQQKQRRYPHAFDFHVERLILSQQDLLESSCIRNGLRRLLTRILHKSLSRNLMFVNNVSSNNNSNNNNGVSVDIQEIDVVSDHVYIKGVATTALALMSIPFCVKTQLGVSGRGHILTFPNLELSISNLRLPISNITIDLGHNAQLVRIDTSVDHQLALSALVRITPEHTRDATLSSYQQRTASFGAVASVDVGQWLTRLGRFSC